MIYVWLRNNTRLANWMSQFAAAKSARCGEVKFYTTDSQVQHLYDSYRDEIFGGTELVNQLPDDISVYTERPFYEPIHPPVPGKDFELIGYFQDVRYYDTALVHKLYFQGQERLKRLIEKFSDWLQRPAVTGISVRRTDYLKIPHILPFCGKQYYRDAIARVPECHDFIVCSDDFPWCKEWFPSEFPDKKFLFMSGESVLDQLYIHSLCQNNILSNSSFAWWSAFLNQHVGKRVMRPSLWNGFAVRKAPDGFFGFDFPGMEVVKNHYTFSRYIHGWFVWFWRTFKRKMYPAKKWLWNLCFKRVKQ